MFVERLLKKDFLEYALRDSFVRDEYVRFGANENVMREFTVEKGRVAFSIGRIDFVYTDFDANNNYMFRGYNGSHDKNWIKFMYGKFGSDYQHEFYKFRTQERRRLLDRVSEQFAKETLGYNKLFEAEDEMDG